LFSRDRAQGKYTRAERKLFDKVREPGTFAHSNEGTAERRTREGVDLGMRREACYREVRAS